MQISSQDLGNFDFFQQEWRIAGVWGHVYKGVERNSCRNPVEDSQSFTISYVIFNIINILICKIYKMYIYIIYISFYMSYLYIIYKRQASIFYRQKEGYFRMILEALHILFPLALCTLRRNIEILAIYCWRTRDTVHNLLIHLIPWEGSIVLW